MMTRKKKAIITVLAIAVLAAVLAVLVAGWAIATGAGSSRSEIIATGPFAMSFGSLYPHREKEIEDWFLDALPQGISKKDARDILAKSFSTDITRGRDVVIHSISGPAGSCSTSVRLKFDRDGGFKSVKVRQHYASVMP